MEIYTCLKCASESCSVPSAKFMTKEQGEKYFKRRSRVNPDFLTPEKLKEAAQKRKLEYVSPLTYDIKVKVDMSTCKWR